MIASAAIDFEDPNPVTNFIVCPSTPCHPGSASSIQLYCLGAILTYIENQRLKVGLSFQLYCPSTGKPDFEAGFARLGFKFDFTAMTVADNAVANDQAKAGPCADRFGGEEWLEHARLDVRGNAGTVVHDFNNQLVVFQAGADADFAG